VSNHIKIGNALISTADIVAVTPTVSRGSFGDIFSITVAYEFHNDVVITFGTAVERDAALITAVDQLFPKEAQTEQPFEDTTQKGPKLDADYWWDTKNPFGDWVEIDLPQSLKDLFDSVFGVSKK
jgi:hypothetical protein